MHRLFVTALLAVLVLAGGGCAAQVSRNRSVTPSAGSEFEKAVKSYLDVQKQQQKGLPTLKDNTDPQRILAHENALAAKLGRARASAKQGDVFRPSVQEHFRSLLKSELSGHDGKSAKEAIKDGNPKFEEEPFKVKIAVNAPYPKDAPMSMVPPNVLLKLPKLPEQLEYRFIGRTLILRDVNANIIVDYIPEATPAL